MISPWSATTWIVVLAVPPSQGPSGVSGAWQAPPARPGLSGDRETLRCALGFRPCRPGCGFPQSHLRIRIEVIITLNFEMRSGEGRLLADLGSAHNRVATKFTVSPLAGRTWLLHHEVSRTHDV